MRQRAIAGQHQAAPGNVGTEFRWDLFFASCYELSKSPGGSQDHLGY